MGDRRPDATGSAGRILRGDDVTTSPYANLTPDQHRLTDHVLSDPDGRDSRDLLIGATASAEDKAAVAEALGGPGAGEEFLTGTATPSTPYEAGRLDWSQGRIDQTAALDPDSGEAYRRGLQDERTALVDAELEQLVDVDQGDEHAAIDFSGPGGERDLRSDKDFEDQFAETTSFEDLTDEDRAYLKEQYPDQYSDDDADGM